MTTEAKPAAKPEEKKEQPILPIHRVLPLIIGAIAPIGKTRKNVQQGYSFRGIDDVYAALNLLLAKYSVTILPELLESHHEVSGTTKSGSNMYRHTIRVRYSLIAGDGSTLKADSEGEGMDTGDKATPKAFSTAFKTMAFQVFCIPTDEKIDSEEDSPEVEAAKPPVKTPILPAPVSMAIVPAKTNGNHPKPPPASTRTIPAQAGAPLPPEEQLYATLSEALPADWTAPERDKWMTAHLAEVEKLPGIWKDALRADALKVPVRS